MSHLVLLDNEAVQALAESTHPRHRRVLSHAHVVAQRTRRQAPIRVAVPTGVRVEAGWDRTAPASAFLNRLRVADIALDTASADIAAAIVVRTGVSVADAHLGAVRGPDERRITNGCRGVNGRGSGHRGRSRSCATAGFA